jgi:tetratricopeptide (TPR) repeat protein
MMASQKLTNCSVAAIVLVTAAYLSTPHSSTIARLAFGAFCLAIHSFCFLAKASIMRLRLLIILLTLFATGCSLPRVIVLNDPLDARQHNDLGVAYEARAETDLALREYERAADLDGQWDRPLVNLGNVLAGQQDWKKAAGSYRKALDRNPANAEAMNNLAWVLLRQGELEQARIWAERAVEACPDNPAFLDTLAEVKGGGT